MRLILSSPGLVAGMVAVASVLVPLVVAALLDGSGRRDRRAVWLAVLFLGLMGGGLYAATVPYCPCCACPWGAYVCHLLWGC